MASVDFHYSLSACQSVGCLSPKTGGVNLIWGPNPRAELFSMAVDILHRERDGAMPSRRDKGAGHLDNRNRRGRVDP